MVVRGLFKNQVLEFGHPYHSNGIKLCVGMALLSKGIVIIRRTKISLKLKPSLSNTDVHDSYKEKNNKCSPFPEKTCGGQQIALAKQPRRATRAIFFLKIKRCLFFHIFLCF